MKKMLLAATLLLSLNAVKSQINYGVKAGLNLASLKESGGGVNVTTDNRVTVVAGAFLNYQLSDKINLQPELLYSGMGGSISGVKLKSDYLAIPLLLQYSLGEKFYVEAGPQIGILLSAKADGTDVKNAYKTTDIQIVPGLGYKFTDNLSVDARYGFSLGNVASSNSGGTDKNRVFSLTLAYTL